MQHSRTIELIRRHATLFRDLTGDELQSHGVGLKYEAMSGKPLSRLIPEAFGLVVEASRRHIGMQHYDVQLQCGIELVHGRIAEMKTGEGKTLTATLGAYLLSLYGKGMHLITFNDYLASRDCEIVLPVYQALGLTAGVIVNELPPEDRRAAYQCDITYGSAKEFGFDFLRDRMEIAKTGDPKAGMMRGLHYALVDEADSVMIDEARTPLIIGMTSPDQEAISQAVCRWAATHVAKFAEAEHFTYDHLKQSVNLSSAGMQLVRSLPEDAATRQVSIQELYRNMKNAIKVRRDFHLDKNYAIIDGEIVIIDEFTGRPAQGRQWQQGIHQAVEAKEKLKISPITRQAASITIQTFFNRYRHLCGMTGTAWTSRRELKKVYRKSVVRIPTHRPTRRTQLPTTILRTAELKYDRIAEEVKDVIASGRAVLIGNRSVATSEQLSAALERHGIEHCVLNARNLPQEADIVADAGQPGRVTVATNMAGRGTDIKLDDEVRAQGGLHVILTELHESQRIDWQLIGRGSRQGDPGSFRIFLSLEDEILQMGLGPAKAARLQSKHRNTGHLHSRQLLPVFLRAQRAIESRHLTDRLILFRQGVDQQKQHFDAGQDPFLNAATS